MKKATFLFLLLFAGCGVTERVEIIREMVGCDNDEDCVDRDPQTEDWCEISSGICNHERLVESGLCAIVEDCDDADATTVDACVGGDCHHTRDVTAPFDPAAPERQDARSLCEQPLACVADSPGVFLAYNQCYGRRDPWNERGYPLSFSMPDLGVETRTLRIRPQLRVGDPSDLFRVTVVLNDYTSSPVLVRDMTGTELEDEGITIEYAPTVETWLADYVYLTINFAEPDAYRTRTLQWALPPGGVMDLDTGMDLNPCLQVAQFMTVPAHGLLRLTQADGTETPQCTGTVRGTDPWAEGVRLPDGLFRTVSDPRLYYASGITTPQRLYRFETLREFVDWWQAFSADPSMNWHPNTICANTTVYEDAVLVNAMAEYEVETVGTRPGTPVTWYDYTTRTQHYGFADRFWTIRDIGTDMHAGALSGYACTWYNAIPSLMSGPGYDCWLDLRDWVSRYTVVPTDATTINPTTLASEWGWLYWYNREIPVGP